MPQPSEPITVLLRLVREGDQDAKETLLKLVYPELRRIAAGRIRRERRGHTFQTGDLIHEAYLRLAHSGIDIKDRVHFYAIAAMFMRRILVDYARKRASQPPRVPGMPAALADVKPGLLPSDPIRLLAVHQALTRLESTDPRQGQVVEMRFFGGMSDEEIAEVLGLSSRTVKRDWAMARAWLSGELAS